MHPKLLKPKRDWVSVLTDRRETKLASGLILPEQETGVERVTEWSGRIVRLGSGDKARILKLEEGMKVVYRGFIRYANRLECDDKWEDGTKKHYFLMAIDDIVGAIREDVKVGFFSNGDSNG